MLRSSFVPREFSSLHERLSSRLSASVPRCCPPAVVSGEPLPQISWSGSLLQRRRPPDLRTVGFIDPTPTLLPGTEILWMRLFDQRSDIGMGVMPTKWMEELLSKFYRRTGFSAEPGTC